MAYKITPFVAFQVRDYDKAVAFYRDILGFDLIKYTDTECRMYKDGYTFYIEKKEEGVLHTFFELVTPDITAAKEAMLAAGCSITHVYGPNSMMIADPYGFRFHLYEQGAQLSDI